MPSEPQPNSRPSQRERAATESREPNTAELEPAPEESGSESVAERRSRYVAEWKRTVDFEAAAYAASSKVLARSARALEQSQAALSDEDLERPLPTRSAPVDSRLGSTVRAAHLRVVERISHPRAVMRAEQYLEHAVLETTTTLVYPSDFATTEAFEERLRELEDEGYSIERTSNGAYGHAKARRSDRIQLGRSERKSLDNIAQHVADPQGALEILVGLGAKVETHELWQNQRQVSGPGPLTQACMVVEKHAEVLRALGAVVDIEPLHTAWQDRSDFEQAVTRLEQLPELKDVAVARSFGSFLRWRHEADPYLSDLPDLYRLFADEGFRRSYDLLDAGSQQDTFYSDRGGVGLLKVTQALEQSGSLEIVERLAAMGAVLDSGVTRRLYDDVAWNVLRGDTQQAAREIMGRLADSLAPILEDESQVRSVQAIASMFEEPLLSYEVRQIAESPNGPDAVLALVLAVQRSGLTSLQKFSDISWYVEYGVDLDTLDPEYIAFCSSVAERFGHSDLNLGDFVRGGQLDAPRLFQLYSDPVLSQAVQDPNAVSVLQHYRVDPLYGFNAEYSVRQAASIADRIPDFAETARLLTSVGMRLETLPMSDGVVDGLVQARRRLHEEGFDGEALEVVRRGTTLLHARNLGRNSRVLLDKAIDLHSRMTPEEVRLLSDDATFGRMVEMARLLAEKRAQGPLEIALLAQVTAEDIAQWDEVARHADGRVTVAALLVYTRRRSSLEAGMQRYSAVSGARPLDGVEHYESYALIGEQPPLPPDQQALFTEMLAHLGPPAQPNAVAVLMAAPQRVRDLSAVLGHAFPAAWGRDESSFVVALEPLLPMVEEITNLASLLELSDLSVATRDLARISVDDVRYLSMVESDEITRLRPHLSSHVPFGNLVHELVVLHRLYADQPHVVDRLHQEFGTHWSLPAQVDALSYLTAENIDEVLEIVRTILHGTILLNSIPIAVSLHQQEALPTLSFLEDAGVDFSSVGSGSLRMAIEQLQVRSAEELQAFAMAVGTYGVSFSAAAEHFATLRTFTDNPHIFEVAADLQRRGLLEQDWYRVLSQAETLLLIANNPDAFQVYLDFASFFYGGLDLEHVRTIADMPDRTTVTSFIEYVQDVQGDEPLPSHVFTRIVNGEHDYVFYRECSSRYPGILPIDLLTGTALELSEARTFFSEGREILDAVATYPEVEALDYDMFVDLYRFESHWERYAIVRERYGLSLKNAIYDPNYIRAYWLADEESDLELPPPLDDRDGGLLQARLFMQFVDGAARSVLDSVTREFTTVDGERVSATEFLERFTQAHERGGKGRTILGLLAVREYEAGLSQQELIVRVLEAAAGYDSVLRFYDEGRVPTGFRASIGMEYEITRSSSVEYGKSFPERSLRSDMMDLSYVVGIGIGKDGVHEIATTATDNPYGLMLEMQLLQELSFIDFNFDQGLHRNSAHGLHITVGGERTLSLGPESAFLQTALKLAAWGGVEVGALPYTGGSSGYIRERGVSNSLQNVFGAENLRDMKALEFRGFSIDKRESFERLLRTMHNGAIALQMVNTYIGQDLLSDDVARAAGAASDADTFVTSLSSVLLRPAEEIPNNVREVLYAWYSTQLQLIHAAEDHNANFFDRELYGYLDDNDEWVDAEDFGGAGNRARFDSVIAQDDLYPSAEAYGAQARISPYDLYTPKLDSVTRALVLSNNLFLKPSVGSGGDFPNVEAMLSVTRMGNQGIEASSVRGPGYSLFETGGVRRDGYYFVQGASERYIAHVAQRALMEFNQRMEGLVGVGEEQQAA